MNRVEHIMKGDHDLVEHGRREIYCVGERSSLLHAPPQHPQKNGLNVGARQATPGVRNFPSARRVLPRNSRTRSATEGT